MLRQLSLAACSSLVLLTACGGKTDSPGATTPVPTAPTTPTNPSPITPVVKAPPALSVQGNRLVDASGTRVRLRGVNRSGPEYMCAQGRGIFDGPSDEPSVRAIASWNINVVRMPMNEACWLGINGVDASYAGANYQKAISDFVALLNKYGILAILELHWSAPGTTLPLVQTPMPNRDHSVEFWSQVAAAYKDNASVMLDLFNEPFPDNNSNSAEAWRCWKEGGTCGGMTYQAAGMQELVSAVRTAGATNVILLGGVAYSARLSGWLANKPADPLNRLAASWHIYNSSQCNSRTCWDADAAPLEQQVPLILGEVGQMDGGTAFVASLLDWMDARQGSYLAWTWDTWQDSTRPDGFDVLALVSNYDGTPTNYGAFFRNRFLGQ